MRDCCGDPDAMRGSPGGIGEEIPEGSQGGILDVKDREALRAFEEVGVLVDGNAGAGDQGLENVNRGSSPCDDSGSVLDVGNEHEVLAKEIKEVEEDYGGFVEAEKESNHLFQEQRVLVENPKAVAAEDSSVAHVGVKIIEQVDLSCSASCYRNDTSVDSRNGAVVLVEDLKEVDKGCKKFVLAKEETEHLVIEKEPFVKTPAMAEYEATSFKDAGVGARESLEATCSPRDDNNASSSAGERKEAEVAGVEARVLLDATCSHLDDNDNSSSAGERKEAVERCKGFVGAVEKSGHIGLQDKLLIKGPEMVDGEEYSEIPGLSPFLTSGDGSENPSETHIVLEVGDSTGPFYEDKGCNKCESVPLVSSGSAADCHLIRIGEQTVKRVDESCSSLPGKSMGSMCCERTLLDGDFENLHLSNVERMECSPCKDNILFSNNGNREKYQPFNSQNGRGLTSSCMRDQKGDVCDHSEENSLSSQEAVARDDCQISSIARGLSGVSLEEVASCFSGEGSSFQQSSNLFAAALDRSSDPSLAIDRERKVTDDVNTASTCCSNVKDPCGPVSDGGMVNSKSVPLIVFRRTNPKRAASLRNNQTDAKPDHLTRKRNGVRKCKKAADFSTLFSSITIKMNKTRRKRSCFHRMARKSVWGEAGSLITVFMENDEPAVSSFDLAQIQNKSLKTRQCCRSRGKKQMAHGDRNLRSPETQCAFSTRAMHLKDQINLQPNFPNVVDSQCSTETSNNALPNLSSPTELGIPSRHGEVDCEPSTDMLASGEKFLQRDGLQGDKDIESTLTQDTSCENMLGECPGVSSRIGSEALVETVADRHLLDPESSPDSDIYNPVVDVSATPIDADTLTIPDAGVNQSAIIPEMTVLNGMHVKILNSSEAIVSSGSASSLDVQLQTGNKKGKKEKKDDKACQKAYTLSEHNLIKEKLHNSEIQNTAMEPLKYVRQRCNGFKKKNLMCSDSIRKDNRKGSRRKACPGESTMLGMAELDCTEEPRKVEPGLETWALSEQDIGNIHPEEGGSLMTDKSRGHKLSRISKMRVGKDKSSPTDSSRQRRLKSHGQKNRNIKSEKSRNKEKNQTLDASQEACGSMKLSPGTACNELEPKDGTCGFEGQPLPQRRAWVLCDDCHKWRCIPTALADMIEETNCRWTCKDNTDKAFADCSIPQEKTNSEINAELEISDASCDEDVPKPNSTGAVKSKLAAAQPASWTPIKSNLYLHRNRKSQTIDETMVCHCKPPSDGCLGCGEQCLNRMLNIECVKGTCPCGEICSNQQFQKRKYTKLKWVPCGKKGFGLQLLEDVSCGQFLIEYVGEVLDFATYEARQKYYASRGQKHFYFMTLNGGEVIDACAKGNLGRFINHSCDPNCRTEKWMVNGEVCIGLFAIRDIKKGEEVTFDYNYVRVFGAAAKKCVCGSSGCRGYIGGDPLNTEVVVQDDSDDEYLEPVMVNVDNEKSLDMDVTLTDANDMVVKDADLSLQKKDLLNDCTPISETEGHQQFRDTICTSPSDVTPLNITFNSRDNLQVKDAISRPISEIQLSEDCSKSVSDIQTKETICPPSKDVQQLEIPLQASLTVINPISDSALNNILASDTIDEQLNISKSFLAKSSHSSHIIKKSKPSAKTMVPQKAKKLPLRSGNAQFVGVEKELNELLDVDGGISKRKDATRGYLKLLFVTAAEGDNVGGASQSIRDLSLILDALLKTKSRTVLMDIISKNGLQMLHNIMKQNRSKFSRIPIIRKLLKVLEFLALKGILTPEHINKGPPCTGMESFKDSMLSLTRHNDIQVHQIARNFRDKWIPRMIKRVEPSDRDEIQLDSQRSYCGWFQSSLFNRRLDQGARESDAIVCVSEPMEQLTSSGLVDKLGETSSHSNQVVSSSLPMTDNSSTTGTRTRKRKSRWDQPSDYNGPEQQNLWSNRDHALEAGSDFVKTAFSDLELGSRSGVLKQNYENHKDEDCSHDGVAGAKNLLRQNMDDEVPPGFGSPLKDHIVTSETLVPGGEVVVGYLQERYLSHLSVSYGIPLALVQKLGDTESDQFWAVAPSMPFHPFPPLPPYPRGKPYPSTLTMESSKNGMTAQGLNETQLCKLNDVESQATDVPAPSASEERPSDNSETRPRNPQITERISWSSNSCGRRFVRPERWNNQKFRRRWASSPQEGSDCGLRGSIRYRDTGRSFRDGRKYWPPWPQEDSGISSKGQKGDGDSSIG